MKSREKPERAIQDAVKLRLEQQEWYVIQTHGNVFQFGLPDLYVCHIKYGTRWIEVKNLANYRFTAAQLKVFPMLGAKGVGVWVVTDPLQVPDILFTKPNWMEYLKW